MQFYYDIRIGKVLARESHASYQMYKVDLGDKIIDVIDGIFINPDTYVLMIMDTFPHRSPAGNKNTVRVFHVCDWVLMPGHRLVPKGYTYVRATGKKHLYIWPPIERNGGDVRLILDWDRETGTPTALIPMEWVPV